MKTFGIILADDHIMFRNLMKQNIEAIPDFAVVGEVGTGFELLQLLKTCRPELIILDISMPELQGIEAAKEIKKNYPEIKILILTMHKSKDHLSSAMAAGVEGYLLKENAYEDLIKAIRDLQQGRHYISNLVLDSVKEIILQNRDGSRTAGALTTREIVILKLMAEGKSSREIADLLYISVPTVNRHRFNIRNKLDMRNNADLIKYAIEKGYTSLAHDV
jgi:DNA-binding NarL/FixJ family response regulator